MKDRRVMWTKDMHSIGKRDMFSMTQEEAWHHCRRMEGQEARKEWTSPCL